jgi:hypothetical protein
MLFEERKDYDERTWTPRLARPSFRLRETGHIDMFVPGQVRSLKIYALERALRLAEIGQLFVNIEISHPSEWVAKKAGREVCDS